ncbi:DUF3576 domain-containing protein [Maritimibacter sp. UBA3975]|uniref:DUF3576 domain-containing protein n=1 Tax=Maritimibacter sp. UBA3975 TaxID=1946833 RepID=UPI000C094C6E|nr:DUF3576 domain-containing protein [Maritimibacter sp. UBA3975]MAM62506.1 hypothetical protein [Maritimibacter sp.]|tara:strand:- start:710 stop:1225 length:516 start_codon:yes stop_codon:yes gene_type:complete
MTYGRFTVKAAILAGLVALTGCSGGLGNLFGGSTQTVQTADGTVVARPDRARRPQERSTIWDLFADRDNPNTTVEVNSYLWNASLDVLSFLPVQTVDPFTGVIVFGYGVPPGGGQAYRATVHVSDPALDARSLNVALQTRGGRAVSTATQHAIEDAILGRARQLRIQDYNL